jgi:hypothetical protein
VNERMNKLHLVSLALIAGLLGCVAFGVYAASIFTIPFSGNVPTDTTSALTITVGGLPYVQGQTTIAWGNTTTGTYTKAIAITNPRNIAVPISLAVTGLPTGITLTWDLPTSVPAFTTSSGTLSLVVLSTATPGAFSGNINIQVG